MLSLGKKGVKKMKVIQAKIPDDLSSEVENLINFGVFKDTSEVVKVALEKMLAEQSREYLRDLTKSAGIKRNEMLEEWKRIRK
jgi:Arc/MetJ-type ribon-helix-helix transcriptional regulator